MNKPSTEPSVNLKNPYLAALLAFLVPGAGHLYQRRNVKATIYFVGILTLFIWGMTIGQWQIMYRLEPAPTHHRGFDFLEAQDDFERLHNDLVDSGRDAPTRKDAKLHWGYWAQAPVGVFTLLSLIQEERYYSYRNVAVSPEQLEFADEIEGRLKFRDQDNDEHLVDVAGTLTLATATSNFGPEMKGTFSGTAEGKAIEFTVRGSARIDRPLSSEPRRGLECSVEAVNGQPVISGELIAFTERSFVNHFLVPPTSRRIEQLHSELGKKYSLADVFTWIAGMLNVLAIWDAFAGPAYGYRMRRQESEDDQSTANPSGPETSKSAPAPATATSSTPAN